MFYFVERDAVLDLGFPRFRFLYVQTGTCRSFTLSSTPREKGTSHDSSFPFTVFHFGTSLLSKERKQKEGQGRKKEEIHGW